MHIGCVRFTKNQPQMISLDTTPYGAMHQEARKDFVFRQVFRMDSS